MLSLDTAPAGTTLTATLLTPPSDGSLSLASNGSFVYTPNSGWVGIDSFTYEASDGSVPSPPVTVTVQTDLTVSSTNYVAVATGDFNGDGNADIVAVNQSGNDVATVTARSRRRRRQSALATVRTRWWWAPSATGRTTSRWRTGRTER